MITQKRILLKDIKIDEYGRTILKHKLDRNFNITNEDYALDTTCPIEDPERCTLKQCGCDNLCKCTPPDKNCDCPPPVTDCGCPPPVSDCGCPPPETLCDCPDIICSWCNDDLPDIICSWCKEEKS